MILISSRFEPPQFKVRAPTILPAHAPFPSSSKSWPCHVDRPRQCPSRAPPMGFPSLPPPPNAKRDRFPFFPGGVFHLFFWRCRKALLGSSFPISYLPGCVPRPLPYLDFPTLNLSPPPPPFFLKVKPPPLNNPIESGSALFDF